AIAHALAQAGAFVNIMEINEANGLKVVEAITEAGGHARYIYCNVANVESVKEAFTAAAAGKTIDLLINNAGIAHIGTAESTSPEDFNKILSVNVTGVFYCIQGAIPFMKDNGGAIINVSSIVAHVGIPDRFAYTMSKGAVHGMTLSVAKDYLRHNIRCNSIAPARVHTPFVDGFIAENYPGKEDEMFQKLSKTQPIGRMGKPQEIGNLVLYLCSDEASFITGSSFPIDGGFITLNN
ncbi:MAG: SDR family oxidoreductase, partial [Bacteroidota bacterium]